MAKKNLSIWFLFLWILIVVVQVVVFVSIGIKNTNQFAIYELGLLSNRSTFIFFYFLGLILLGWSIYGLFSAKARGKIRLISDLLLPLTLVWEFKSNTLLNVKKVTLLESAQTMLLEKRFQPGG